MSNFLARCAAIAVVGGGFTATGDLGWLAARGMRLINARTVPSEQAAATEPVPNPAQPQFPTAPALPATPPPPSLPTPPVPKAADPFRGPPAPLPVARAAEEPRPPVGGPERLDVARLQPGERVTIWIGRAAAAGPQPSIVFDLIDPATGEALLVGRGMAPRRVSIGPRVVACGDTLLVTPSGPARQAPHATERLGPVTAIAIGRR